MIQHTVEDLKFEYQALNWLPLIKIFFTSSKSAGIEIIVDLGPQDYETVNILVVAVKGKVN